MLKENSTMTILFNIRGFHHDEE